MDRGDQANPEGGKMQRFRSLGAALMHYFNQEPNAYKAGAATWPLRTVQNEEQIAAINELKSYGYEFETT